MKNLQTKYFTYENIPIYGIIHVHVPDNLKMSGCYLTLNVIFSCSLHTITLPFWLFLSVSPSPSIPLTPLSPSCSPFSFPLLLCLSSQLILTKQRDKTEVLYRRLLKEDKGTGQWEGTSYIDFLCQVHRDIKEILS